MVTFRPSDFLVVKSTTRMDWPATQKKVLEYVAMHTQSTTEGAMEAIEIFMGLKAIVKKCTVKATIKALSMSVKMDEAEVKREAKN